MALNILVFDSELERVEAVGRAMALAGVDAVIVQVGGAVYARFIGCCCCGGGGSGAGSAKRPPRIMRACRGVLKVCEFHGRCRRTGAWWSC